jgi:excinuclease UvrABC nuclease subunit
MISPSTIDPLQLPSVGMTDRKQLPQIPCIYFAIDIYDQIQYIGRSVNPRQRWQNHHRQAQLIGCRIAYMECDKALLDEVETALIEWFNPPLNGRAEIEKGRRFTFTVEPELYEPLKLQALRERRSICSLLNHLAAKYLADQYKH